MAPNRGEAILGPRPRPGDTTARHVNCTLKPATIDNAKPLEKAHALTDGDAGHQGVHKRHEAPKSTRHVAMRQGKASAANASLSSRQISWPRVSGPTSRRAVGKAASSARCLLIPRMTAPASLLHAQRHVDPSITTLAAQDATVGCAADRLLRRGNFLMVQALTACATVLRRSYPLAKPS